MLSVISGSFHPGLESALIGQLQKLKNDPWAPIAIVTPSSRLMDRLQQAIALANVSVLNVYFHTFFSLAQDIVALEAPLEKPILSDPQFFDTLVKRIIKEDRPFAAFDDLAVPDGFPPAVRDTLRDLLDAGIDEENVEAAVQEEFAGQSVDLGSLRSLLQLYRLYLNRIKILPVLPRSELLKRAIELAPTSTYLKPFTEILFYGFYDLTGLQTDFFQAVVKNHPSRFFFPYVHEHPSYAFAKRFRDTFVQPVMRDELILDSLPSTITPQIVNVSGFRDESWYVADEIRRLHDKEGIPFSDMAIVARTADRLRQALPMSLRNRSIPFRSTSKLSLGEYPIVRNALEQLALASDWPEKDSWSNYCSKTIKHLSPMFQTDEHWKLLTNSLESLPIFELIEKKISKVEFTETLKERWEKIEGKDPDPSEQGVSLLHAEAARGLAYKVLFLIGVEEKVFPRIIREDPFLRDDARLALNQTLGHKIGQKLTALEEERLLFEIVTTAATQYLTILYQRSDDDGGVVGPSTFIKEAQTSIPRSQFEKIKATSASTLSFADVMVGYLSSGHEKEAIDFSGLLGRDKKALEQGLCIQRFLHKTTEPGAFDGLVGTHTMNEIFRDGRISPTALEVFGQCPYKYFATKLLNLEPKEESLLDEKLAADVKGTALHEFLEVFYQRLTNNGTKPLPTEFPTVLFDDIFEEIIGRLTSQDVNLHPVLWRATQLNLKELLSIYVANDIDQARVSQFKPTYFEGEITTPLDPPLDGFQWTGKIDRIDIKDNVAHVIDYKTGKPPKTKNVVDLALKGLKVQAPLYILLAQKIFKDLARQPKEINFSYSFLRDEPELRTLNSKDWSACRTSILKTIRQLIDHMQAGNFLMMPDDYCSVCEVAQICRKNHGLSRVRSKQGVGEKLWDIRNQ